MATVIRAKQLSSMQCTPIIWSMTTFVEEIYCRNLGGKCMNNLRTSPQVPAKTFLSLFFHGAFAPSFIWRRRPWCCRLPALLDTSCRVLLLQDMVCWFWLPIGLASQRFYPDLKSLFLLLQSDRIISRMLYCTEVFTGVLYFAFVFYHFEFLFGWKVAQRGLFKRTSKKK